MIDYEKPNCTKQRNSGWYKYLSLSMCYDNIQMKIHPLSQFICFGEVVEQWACCDGGDRLNGSPRSKQEKMKISRDSLPKYQKQKTDCSTKIINDQVYGVCEHLWTLP